MAAWWLLISMVHLYYAAADDSNPYKLPNSVRPSHYDLTLKPDIYYDNPKSFHLYGDVEISAYVLEDTDRFNLHALSVTIKSIQVIRGGKDIFKSKEYSDKYQWYVIYLKETLKNGDDIKIQIKFETPIDHSLFGLYYYSRRVRGTGVQYGATTQFEPTYARKAFPCFDEPAFKATFKVTIFRKPPHYSISNAPLIKSTEQPNGWVKDTYETTPKMPSYLVAVIVTQYKALTEMYRNVNLTIYYPEGKEKDVQFAMKISKQVFRELQDYFDIAYPMPKLDQIGFNARDYMFQGMENYGMITYGDPFIYTGKNIDKAYLAGVILHEITHQWFGNLVTMKWWDDLWLNEGMTEFFSFLRGKWLGDLKTRRIGLKEVLSSLSLEVRTPSLPVTVPWAQSADEILSVINDITYAKGGSVVKMAEIIMGEDNFMMAMRQYMRNNQYSSVTEDNLWETLTKINKEIGSNLDMTDILTPWLTQPGFPVVTVQIDRNANVIRFQQELFYHKPETLDARMPEPSPYKYKWPIPLQWKTGNSGKSKVVVVHEDKGSIKLSEPLLPKDWIIVNPEMNFYYIVNYDKRQWLDIAAHLQEDHMKFNEFTRGKLIFDLMTLYRATTEKRGNYVTADTVKKVLAYRKVDKSPFVQSVIKAFVDDRW